MILVFSYCLMGSRPVPPQKQSASSFFRGHEVNDYSTKEASRMEEKKLAKSSTKPHLIHVKGLDDLYAPNNISEGESRALLVWPHMRLLLSRSDSLPETMQGIKEASMAWKDLCLLLEREKFSKLSSSNNPDYTNCPSSVYKPDSRETSSTGIILELPCGLVDDSSITVVGILNGNNGSFHIDLVGSQLSKEMKPPIILHYNVSLPGDNMTQEAFIVQNTWTNETGWSMGERCPSHRSTKTTEVDGLVLCNEQIIKSTGEENLNVTHPGSDTSTNFSGGSAHASANFPFVEGNPFTATLWAGLDGFHMTVNGRHETSFQYREKLEPWSVGSLKVDGGVEVLSALAKGLPVSEDHDLVVDAEHLKAPLVSRKRLVMLIGVFSTGNNFERRMALRRSWMQYEAVRRGDVAVRFFIGLHKHIQVNYELWREAQVYGDIQLMPFVDYYGLIALKTVAVCILGTKLLPAKYIMKTDDDAFVRIDEVLSSLKGKPTNGLLYGLISSESSPHREKDSKWYISAEEWPHPSYPPWAHGPGYIISRDIAKFIVRGHQERDLKLFKLEDVAVGIWIEQFKKSGKEVHYVNDEKFYNAGCESNYILAHYQGPRMVLCLWEKLQKERKPICCE
ncbi:hydroxyproline O-galactosyltransferase GALT3 isoform X2 [Tripterygium wilfordii]|nr:hydroxyproline O-galactosyltransferase GALT3 isoform X2 [Tripterygium wilfordii]XP_038720128.1 hydroxyproline O-galactosyltransferase GALT3 isoform X2 [Tripterygium wilfordii]